LNKEQAISTRRLHGFVILSVCAALAACSANADHIKLTAADAGSTVNMRVGETLEISLEGNPTTGYTWELSPDQQDLLVQDGQTQFKADTTLLGSGGLVTLQFKPLGQGTAELKLIYHRTFEPPQASPLRTFTIKVVVGK
jgi:inhibitor of cysteine peptidase